VEQQIDVVRAVLACNMLAEVQPLGFVGDVGDKCGDARCGRSILFGAGARLLERLFRYVAGRDVASIRRELANQCTTHPGTATGDDRVPSREVAHGRTVPASPPPWHAVETAAPRTKRRRRGRGY